jgi:hypothetical protein
MQHFAAEAKVQHRVPTRVEEVGGGNHRPQHPRAYFDGKISLNGEGVYHLSVRLHGSDTWFKCPLDNADWLESNMVVPS